jgi:RNA polymerase sigma-70 factor (ECF subfamily)
MAEEAEARLSEWMRASQAGDANAYRELLNAVEPQIRSIVRSKIRDEAAAQDVVQNTLLSIHRGRATYRAERPFGPWMRAIVRNAIVDHFRESKRRNDRETPLVHEEWPDLRADTSDAFEAGVGSLPPELAEALAALPEAQRVAVSLIQVSGLSVAEAALQVGVSPGALKVRAHRGYQALRSTLANARVEGEWKSARPPSSVAGSRSRGTK